MVIALRRRILVILLKWDDRVERYIKSHVYVLVISLCFGILGGICNVLVDVDHIPLWILGMEWNIAPADIFGFGAGRPLHSIDGLLAICTFTLSSGFISWVVLRMLQPRSDPSKK
jgi:hypothetical protein